VTLFACQPDAIKKKFLNKVAEIGSYVNISTSKPYSLADIVAQQPELYAPYYESLLNLIYYFWWCDASQYRQILDDHQVTPFAIRSNSSSKTVQQGQQDFDSEPDPQLVPGKTSPSTTMHAGAPRAPAGANARVGGRATAFLTITHTGTLLWVLFASFASCWLICALQWNPSNWERRQNEGSCETQLD
jgi:hypothetical protein